MRSIKEKTFGIMVVMLVLLTLTTLALLPRAFDRRWQFWGEENPESTITSAPCAEGNTPTQTAPVATATEVPLSPTTAPPAVEIEAEMPLLDCGEFGTYAPILVGDNWEYWMQEQSKITGRYGLVDLKIQGGTCRYSIPPGYIAVLNQSAGQVIINGIKGNLGNPVLLNGSELLTGTIFSSWEAGNDSAGVMLTLYAEQ